MKYCVVTDCPMDWSSKTFESRVNDLLKDGWKLQGGVSISDDDNFITYAQALTKED